MAYDTAALTARYRQLLDPILEDSGPQCRYSRDTNVSQEEQPCESDCQHCCLGLVEVVRSFSEKAASLEQKARPLPDTAARAARLRTEGD